MTISWAGHTRREVTRYALQQRAQNHENWPIGRAKKWLYTLKAIVCLVLNRWAESYNYDTDLIDSVAVWNVSSRPADNGYDWWELGVGRGFVRGWTAYVYWDGN